MLCWLNRQDRKLLREVNAQFEIPIFYSKNFDEFSFEIKEDDYLVVSCSALSSKYNKIEALARKHGKKIFHIFSRQNSNGQRELDFMCEPNVVSLQYGPKRLIDEFLEKEEYYLKDETYNKIWVT